MRHVVLGAIVAIALLLIVILGLSVYHDAHITPRGRCRDQNGSVCVSQPTCPAGFTANVAYTCFSKTYTCCLPV